MYIFTHHAIEQFKKRSTNLGQCPQKPQEFLMKLIHKTVEEEIDPIIKVRRLINNKFKEVKYLIAEGWRFVVSSENIILTIERTNKYQN